MVGGGSPTQMKGCRAEGLEVKLLMAIREGDDVAAQHLERRILQKERKQQQKNR